MFDVGPGVCLLFTTLTDEVEHENAGGSFGTCEDRCLCEVLGVYKVSKQVSAKSRGKFRMCGLIYAWAGIFCLRLFFGLTLSAYMLF